jgi:hypothetical protein
MRRKQLIIDAKLSALYEATRRMLDAHERGEPEDRLVVQREPRARVLPLDSIRKVLGK